MPTWDAVQYLQFASERTQPAIDLASRIAVAHPARIIDLGCGPGNSTGILRQRWPEAHLIGLDSSAEMIAAATEAYPQGEWLLADISTWTAETPFNIVFSNATLHWLPNHAQLLPHLLAQVAPGGALAVQMPAHYRSPVHEAIVEVAADARWRHLMAAPLNAMTKEPPPFYYNLFTPLTARLELWETEYYHVMESPQAIVEWFRGTGLRPYLEALPDDAQRQDFEALLLERYAQRYSREDDGKVLFPFRRLFIFVYND
jgi:trans-aconitate 2-methyltransferase